MMLDPDFWNNQESAQTVISELNGLKEIVNAYYGFVETQENMEMSLELLREEDDEEFTARYLGREEGIERPTVTVFGRGAVVTRTFGGGLRAFVPQDLEKS